MTENKVEEKNKVNTVASSNKHRTEHRFDPEEEVFVAEYRQNRDSQGYTKIENQFRFTPLKAVVDRVIITSESGKKTVRYKMRGKAASLFDEDDVCKTEEEAIKLCEERNKA